MSHHEVLVQQMVDIHKATAEFREAPERNLASSSHMNSSNKHFANRSVVQRRLSKSKWNPFVAILAQAISCSNVRGVFPVHERFWLCLVQVSRTQFYSFPAFLMARVSDGTNVPISPAPTSSSNLVSPNGSLPDLEGAGSHPSSTMEENIEAMLTDSQFVSQPWKRIRRPSPVDPARQNLGTYSDIVMAPQPLDLLDQHLTASGQSFFISSTALRACRSRHLGTLMRWLNLGNLSKLASIHFPSSVLIPKDSTDICWPYS